jgi:hypothetical protein
MSESKDKEYRLIRISKENYDILNNLGKTNDTFNTVLSRIFEENNLLGIVSTDDGVSK